MILFLISFVAGVLTVLAPCVLPLLPVVVGGSVAGERNWRKAYVISVSLGLSVFLFTFLLKVTTAFIDVPQGFWELVSGGILVLFGVAMLFPWLWDGLGIVNKMNLASNRALGEGYRKQSFWGDVLMGAALGPVFSSCSPTYFVILATVLPASYLVGTLDLIAYCIGLSGFLLLIALLGQRLVDKLGIAIDPSGWFRKSIGVLFLLVGLAVLTGTMAKLEAWMLANGFDATRIEQHLLGAGKDNNASGASATSTAQLSDSEKSKIFQKAPELVAPDGYINTEGKPVTIAEFKGKKVVLLDIWTYSCINCQRTLPYLKMWYDRYESEGLEIIGIHTPEFSFEKVQKNVEQAVKGFGIKYPVVLDNEYRTWNALGNQYWPRKYLIDIDGYIVYDHIGEGNYDETEKAIQKALAERAARLGEAAPEMPSDIAIDTSTPSAGSVGSPETYFGASRNEYLANGKIGTLGAQTLVMPTVIRPNQLYLSGTWQFNPEYAVNTTAGARIRFRYSAKSVYFVGSADSPVSLKVTIDGALPRSSAGADVDAEGKATVGSDRLYKLIEGADYGEHTIDIEILSPGLNAYTFTFG